MIGLYLHPPEKAVVLCVDEKSSIQALDRTNRSCRCARTTGTAHPRLRPPWHGNALRRARHRQRRGTGRTYARHRHQEFLKFLQLVANRYPRGQVHLVLDNYRTHKHPRSTPG